MLGNEKISYGPNMVNDVVQAVHSNAFSSKGVENTIIILSPVTKEEMIAVRTIIAKYGKHKTIIIVNCKLNPTPRELMRAEKVYSLLPLNALPIVSRFNKSSQEKRSNSINPSAKVVLMRRFPKDWEIFMDVKLGSGFELVDTVPANEVGQKGPSIQQILASVKKYFQSKYDG